MTNTKEWEKEFEELKLSPYNPARGEIVVNIDAVKSFISSLLSRRDAEVVEVVEKSELATCKWCEKHCYRRCKCVHHEHYYGFGLAKEAILAALKDQTKEQ